jgi:hypothetical protein
LGRARLLAGFLCGFALVLGWMALARSLQWFPFPESRKPTFQRLTFRRGNVVTARFAQEGASIFYGASWDDQTLGIFESVPGRPETKSLGIWGADLLSVSKKGELAILLHGQGLGARPNLGILARMPIVGGSPRELLSDVKVADWAPNGETLAVLHQVGERLRLEFPIGRVWGEVAATASMLRVAPSGRAVAFLEIQEPTPRIRVMDREGRSRSLLLGSGRAYGLAWSRDGKRLYTSWGPSLYEMGLWELPLEGKPRLLLRGPKSYYLNDVDREGRLLVELSAHRQEAVLQVGGASPRVITWLDGCDVVGLGADGETVLLADRGEASGSRGSLWLRKPGSRDPIGLGEGMALAGLSPEGRWVPVQLLERPEELVLLSTGAEQARTFSLGGVRPLGGIWHPGGRKLFLAGLAPGGARSDGVLDLETGAWTAFTGLEAVRSPIAFSPDGRQIAFEGSDGALRLMPSEGGQARHLAVRLQPREQILQWSLDGRSLFVADPTALPIRVYRLEIQGGRRVLWREVALDPVEFHSLLGIAISRDGRSLAYSYRRVLSSDLYLIQGLP